MLSRCGKCAHVFDAIVGLNRCPSCGTEVRLDEMPADVPRDSDATPTDPLAGTPAHFEAAPGLGSLAHTFAEATFQPGAMFKGLDARHSPWLALLFGWIIAALGGTLGTLEQRLLHRDPAAMRAQFATLREKSPQMGPLLDRLSVWMERAEATPLWRSIALAVFGSALLMLFFGGFIHAILFVFGGAKNGFGQTLRAVGFAGAPALFLAVPMCGNFLALLWVPITLSYALAGLHRIETGRAVGAVLAAMFLGCCATIIAGFAMVSSLIASA